MKKCKSCALDKSLTEFYVDKNMKSGYKNSCKKCTSKQSHKWKKENKVKWLIQRQRYRCTVYSISLEQYNKKLQEQNNKCAICGVDGKDLSHTLCCDHNHQTGEIRGLLCKHCNFMIGWAKDNVSTLEQSIRYLNSYAK